MTDVSIKALSKVYPEAGAPSVDRLSLEIPSGELTALLGPSGCGKTTTMKMIAGLLHPTSGDIAFNGRSVLKQKPENRGAVMVFQNYLLFPYMNVAENIGFGLRMRRRPAAEISRRVGAMLDLVKLPDLGDRKPAALSGGQQQRVALARALIVEPDVLLLDEPLSNLDAHLRFEMRDLIRSLQQKLGITTIFVTHDQEEAVVLADRVAFILEGRLKQYDRPEVFYKRPADEATARFFGGQNFIAGTAMGCAFEGPFGSLRLPEGIASGKGIATIRPENIVLGGDRGAANRFQARVLDSVYLGTQTRLKVQVGHEMLDIVTKPGEAQGLSRGDQVWVTLPPVALWVLES